MPEESMTPDRLELTRRMFEVPTGAAFSQAAVVDGFSAFFAPMSCGNQWGVVSYGDRPESRAGAERLVQERAGG
jgi:hypothetical protein